MKANVLLSTVLTVLGSSAYAADLSYSAFTEKSAKNDFCSISVTEPQLMAMEQASHPLRDFIRVSNARWKDHAEKLKAEYEQTINGKDQCQDVPSSYQIEVSFEIKTALDAAIASIRYNDYRYSGGAHGMTAIAAETFDAETGERYRDLSAFFDESKLPAIKAKLLSILKYDEGFDPEFGFNNWSKEATSLTKIQNFNFTPNGMEVFFQPYEVGPYAAGAVTGFFSWDDLNKIGLRKEGPALRLPVSNISR